MLFVCGYLDVVINLFEEQFGKTSISTSTIYQIFFKVEMKLKVILAKQKSVYILHVLGIFD